MSQRAAQNRRDFWAAKMLSEGRRWRERAPPVLFWPLCNLLACLLAGTDWIWFPFEGCLEFLALFCFRQANTNAHGAVEDIRKWRQYYRAPRVFQLACAESKCTRRPC